MSEEPVQADWVPRVRPRRHLPLWIALLVVLVHGLVYVVVVPPWQHYDEPSHFEYSWLIAHRLQLPVPGDVDLTLRRELIRSMGRHGFYHDLGGAPDADSLAPEQLLIGISQLDDPPGYYLWAAAWMWPVRNQSLETQLVAARLSSLALLMIIVGLGYATTAAITRPGSPLRWMVPLSMALLPSFVDLMTAMNNDAGANAAFALVICSGVIMIRRGVSIPRLLILLAGVAICFLIKRTVAYAAVLVPLILILAWWRPRLRWFWLGMGAAVLALLLVVFDWGDAAYWYRGSLQSRPTQAVSTHPELELGSTAFQLDDTADLPPPGLLQMLPHDTFQTLGGKTLTVGGWMWSSRPITIAAPQVVVAGQGTVVLPAPLVSVSSTPQFRSYTLTLPSTVDRAWIVVSGMNPLPSDSSGSGESPAHTLNYDGLVMALGEFAATEPPQFANPSAEAGQWGGSPFTNLLRNPSADATWPFMRPALNAQSPLISTREFWPFNLLLMPLDRGGGDWYFRLAADNMFRTFWAKFGWGHIAMPDIWYRMLAILALMGVAGAIVALIQHRRAIPWKAAAFLALTAALVWLFVWMRGIHSSIYEVFIPGARYGYPAVFPVLLSLVAGWYTLIDWVSRRIGRTWSMASQHRVAALAFALPLLVLDVAAILRIVEAYANR